MKIKGTRFNSQQGPDGYSLQFETDDKLLYKRMVRAAQKCVDEHSCSNCVHYYREGSFCGYNANICELGHDLEYGKSDYHIYFGKNCTDFVKGKYDPFEARNRELKKLKDKKRQKYSKYETKLNEYLKESKK